MSRRARNQTSVSLFPFLAVLLCAMGALLVLLVITTRQIRDEAIRQAAEKAVPAPELPPPALEPEPAYQWPVWEVTLGPAQELERRVLPTPPPPSLLAPKPVFVKRETPPPPPDLTRELQQLASQIRQVNSQLAERRHAADEVRKRRAALSADIEKREDVLKNAEQVITNFQSEQRRLSQDVASLEQNFAATKQEYERIRSDIASLASRPRNSPNALRIVPYAGQQGTTRRPILIECAGDRIRFVPEGIELTERDLIGFSLDENPLLAGVLAAEAYWLERDRSEGKLNRPYVLLIVRPDGIPAYYAARQLLQQYQQPSGYELLTADQDLALPEAEPPAQQRIAQAIQRQLQKRGGTPALARTPFPQADPRLLDRLRSGEESLATGLGQGNENTESRAPAGSNAEGRRFKFVQTSQGLQMVPIDEAELKRFDPAGNSGSREVAETRAGPPGNESAVANGGVAEPAPLPAHPQDSKIKRVPGGGSSTTRWSSPNSGTVNSQPSGAASDSDAPRDPTQVPDAWTPLLEARQRSQQQSAREKTGRNGGAQAGLSAPPSASGQGITSPFGGDAGTLAFKRTIAIKLSDTELQVAGRNPLTIPTGISTAQLMSATVAELRQEVDSWKAPPEEFHWKPSVRFVVYPGGNQYLERLRPAFEEQGLLSGVDYEIAAPESDWRPIQK